MLRLCSLLWWLVAGPVWAEAVPLAPGEAVPVGQVLADRMAGDTAHALVIGVSDYDARAWSDLGYVQTEVEDVSAALAAQGFRVERPRADGRLTKAEMRQAVRQFVQTYGARPENRLVLYFATHGAKEVDGYGLLIASDSLGPGEPGYVGSAYSVDEIAADLSGARARHLFLFFNACFSGALLPAMGADSRGGDPAVTGGAADWALRLLDAPARLVLTAGSDDQVVPDRDNPFARAVTDGLGGAGDLDGDGLVLGTELAQFVRARVARATLDSGRPNDPVFAILPGAETPGPAGLQGDFVFLSPRGPSQAVDGSQDAVLAARAARLPGGQFTECADCPVMVELPDPGGGPARLAMARLEVSFAEWDACYREFGCRRTLSDHGEGRGDRAAGGVTWADALDFTLWANAKAGARCAAYRLPSLAEWQAAATAESRADRAVCRDCDRAGGLAPGRAERGGTLPSNAFGLHDMAGNLWEWTAEGPACGTEALLAGSACGDGIVAGGSFATMARALPAARDGAVFPRSVARDGYALPTVGLRLVCDLAAD